MNTYFITYLTFILTVLAQTAPQYTITQLLLQLVLLLKCAIRNEPFVEALVSDAW